MIPARALLICQDGTNASVPFPETRHQTVYYCKNHFEMSPCERIAKVFSHLSFHRCGRGQATGFDELYLNRLSVGFRVGSFSYFGFRNCGWRKVLRAPPLWLPKVLSFRSRLFPSLQLSEAFIPLPFAAPIPLRLPILSISAVAALLSLWLLIRSERL